jgi:hypothetical protein
MNKEQIMKELKNNYTIFADFIFSFQPSDFLFSPANKWTAGEHAEHLLLSVTALEQALVLPKDQLIIKFGTNSRSSCSYDSLVDQYLKALKMNSTILAGRFSPNPVLFIQLPVLMNQLQQKIDLILLHLNRYDENDLDRLTLPHPLLGKLSLREMMYFMIYHARHHQEGILRQLLARDRSHDSTS